MILISIMHYFRCNKYAACVIYLLQFCGVVEMSQIEHEALIGLNSVCLYI